jgi:RNA recognition motif-containing protein
MKSILENLRRLSLLAFAVIAVFISYTLFPAYASATIYVENLSFDVQQEDLRQVFSAYGEVKRINLPTDRETGRSRGSAYVELFAEVEEDAAIEALNGSEWLGRDIKVSKGKPRSERDSGGSRGSSRGSDSSSRRNNL